MKTRMSSIIVVVLLALVAGPIALSGQEPDARALARAEAMAVDGAGARDVAAEMRTTFRQSGAQVAGILRRIRYRSAETTEALAATFRASAGDVATFMGAAGFTTRETADGLLSVMNVRPSEAVKALVGARYELPEIAGVQREVMRIPASQALADLRGAGVAPTRAVNVVGHAYNATAQDIVREMFESGASPTEIVEAVAGPYDASVEQMASWLLALHVDPEDIVMALKDGMGAALLEVISWVMKTLPDPLGVLVEAYPTQLPETMTQVLKSKILEIQDALDLLTLILDAQGVAAGSAAWATEVMHRLLDAGYDAGDLARQVLGEAPATATAVANALVAWGNATYADVAADMHDLADWTAEDMAGWLAAEGVSISVAIVPILQELRRINQMLDAQTRAIVVVTEAAPGGWEPTETIVALLGTGQASGADVAMAASGAGVDIGDVLAAFASEGSSAISDVVVWIKDAYGWGGAAALEWMKTQGASAHEMAGVAMGVYSWSLETLATTLQAVEFSVSEVVGALKQEAIAAGLSGAELNAELAQALSGAGYSIAAIVEGLAGELALGINDVAVAVASIPSADVNDIAEALVDEFGIDAGSADVLAGALWEAGYAATVIMTVLMAVLDMTVLAVMAVLQAVGIGL